jgi:hypothetical protein
MLCELSMRYHAVLIGLKSRGMNTMQSRLRSKGITFYAGCFIQYRESNHMPRLLLQLSEKEPTSK